MTLIFILSALFCIYTYFLYPLLIWWLSKTRPAPETKHQESNIWPEVSIVLAVHNEAKNIRKKLDILRQIDYPNPLQIVVVSDGSDDGTNEFLAEQGDIDFFQYADARGKPTALNIGMESARGEIVVFMDARQGVSPDCVKQLVKHFHSPQVGAVSGELVMTRGENEEAENIGLYWRYEKWIRSAESRYYSTAGATGALYAVRRSDVISLPADTLLDDFETPIATLKKGKRTLFEPGAVAFDKPSSTGGDEFRRKVRTLAGNYQSFVRNPWLFNPARNRIFLQFLSHKVFRLLVPYAMLAALVSSGLSENFWIKSLFFTQIVFYLVGIGAFLSSRLSRFRIANFIKIFLQMNYAAVYGLYHYLSRKNLVRWKSV